MRYVENRAEGAPERVWMWVRRYNGHTEMSVLKHLAPPADAEEGYSLAELRDGIGGGYIELYWDVPPCPHTGQQRVMVLDDDGIRKGFAVNQVASYMAGTTIRGPAMLVLVTDIK